MKPKPMKILFLLFLVASVTPFAPCQSGKLKVYILAGQSNMEGHARVETFDYLGDDPATAPLLAKMRGRDGKPVECSGAWISYFTGGDDRMGEGFGRLTAGFGARQNPMKDGGKIGPEFTFGITMDAAFKEPVLIIKTAWGGKSLFHDYRPPSAGVYPRSAEDVAKDRYKESDSGRFYRLMVKHVKEVLSDPGRVCPEYRANRGYELAGFVWFQGFNDLVTREAYPSLPKGKSGNRFAPYSDVMAALIRDVRRDLDAPKMPVVIGVLGVDGLGAKPDVLEFRRAMAAPADLPEFRGNVVAVETAPFWAEELAAIDAKREQGRQRAWLLKTKNKDHANKDGTMSEEQQKEHVRAYEAELISEAEVALWKRGASNGEDHYLGCAKTLALIGQAFAEALLKVDSERRK